MFCSDHPAAEADQDGSTAVSGWPAFAGTVGAGFRVAASYGGIASMARRALVLLLLCSALLVPGLGAQEGVAAPCRQAASSVPEAAREACLIAAQAAEAAPPQLGILVARGNPTIGSASPGGLRLGMLPRVSASANVNIVIVRLPDILAHQAGSSAQRLNEAVGIPAPAITGAATVGIFDGVRVMPTVAGVGSIDVLGSATWLPFAGGRHEGFRPGSSELAYGLGARVGVIRETFETPGFSVSLVRHRLAEVRYGNVCPGLALSVRETGEGYSFDSGICPGGGDPGDISVDMSSWSSRAVIGKHLFGLGFAGGLGYDRFSSSVDYGFRTDPAAALPGQDRYFARARDLRVGTGRWSAYVNGSYTLIVATFGIEAGWMQGSRPIQGFPAASDFDPRQGTFFGSVGARLAL